jgi:hypothetical protein
MHEFRLDYQTMNMDVLRKVPKRFQECAVIDAAISHEAGRDRVRILLLSAISTGHIRANDLVLSSCDVPILAIMNSEDLRTRSIGWHDWQQQKSFAFWTAVQRRMASKDVLWSIIVIIVQPWSGAT